MSDTTAIYNMLGQVGDVTIEALASLCRMSKTRARIALKQLDDDGSIAIMPREETQHGS